MTAEWKKYSNTKEINDELGNAKHGWIFIDTTKVQHDVTYGRLSCNEWDLDKITHYLICEPQPHAEMQAIWAKTGQPVEINNIITDEWEIVIPQWTSSREYRFAQPKKEVIYYRDYLIEIHKKIVKRTTNRNEVFGRSPAIVETMPEFIRWIHTEWQELEV